jgi:hypothetical protein
MGRYCTLADVARYFERWGEPNPLQQATPTVAEDLLEHAARTIDRHLGWLDNATPDRAYEDVSEPQQDALREACCAEVFALVRTAPDDVHAVWDGGVVSAGSLGLSGSPAPRPPSPATIEALAGAGLRVHSGTVRADPEEDEE